MTHSPIAAIFFDAAGVFYDRPLKTADYAAQLLGALGYPLALNEAAATQKAVLYTQATEGRISHEAYWDEALRLHGVADDTLRAGLVARILSQTHEVYAYPGGADTLRILQERGFRLGVVTDTIYPVKWKMRWLEQVGVARYISIVACSTELGSHKPEPAMYLNAVRQAGLEPAQAAFVGHDARELAGARRAGLATVAVNYDPEALADYFAQSLPDLLNVPLFQALPFAPRILSSPPSNQE